ncbi:hypothetical protein, partial [Psychrobacter sp. TB20-MNA-CIBAN-0197]|uniref:hypothetical protein n=1 Tax=Psychrobacter sp. TB20-MNA-CIBAN-0197 TaxID=3140453 RepID=UPI003316E597
ALGITAAACAAASRGRRASARRTALAILPGIAAGAAAHRAEHRPRRVAAAAVTLAGEQTAQGLRQFRRLSVAQINHMQIARIALR